MSRSSTLIGIGVFIALLPFIGVSSGFWLRFVIPVCGIVVAVIGFLIRSDLVRKSREAMPQAPAAPTPDVISPIA